MKLVIIGGVAGGASAAARARRLSEDAEIVLFERGPNVSFANCGLPYYVGGEIVSRDKLLVTTPERLRTRFRLDVRTRSLVESIDRNKMTVTIRDLTTGKVYEESYDKLILAPGAAPLRPNIPGLDLPGIFTLRNLQDVDRIKQRVSDGVANAIVVGGGFIGLEMVENFIKLGIKTTLIERNTQVLGPLDAEMTTPINQTLKSHGVNVQLSQNLESIQQVGQLLRLKFSSGLELDTEMAIIGVGVKPESQLAIDAGLNIGSRGGIKVNDHLQTSDPNIYAVGDAIEVKDFVLGHDAMVPLAGPANRQGRIAVNNIFGMPSRYRGTQGTAVVGVLGKTAAMTGASEKVLRRVNKPYRKVYIHPAHHAGYYPGAEGMTLKMLFDPTSGLILGAQGVGGAGVDKRIDVIAVAIQAKMTVYDLEEMELCYAPQYGSAKDPVNMLGFVAAGMLRGEHPQLNWDDVLSCDPSASEAGPYLLDVRTPEEFSKGHVPGAVNISVDELRSRLDEIPDEREIAAYCQVGQRGYLATCILRQKGYSASNVGGGYSTYLLNQPK
jgi:NADPH-dependent 2,4-dienoyl-CoA reductase/sulfur reductase-like enzyme/rhodanese-related sulfurtransferase